ncbi:unnamed protein product [Didymodactylos carnosus]|uniref:Nuclear receptor domain-containing protein n=1 Tax=Didymodactylos carnosus TaxID=1234261 RepID=A0A813PJ82_9BILA|nr:unnamed protein product [Didymodactylos carnosus]CAF0754935.1 unnamed protein product [Didymodactylos carnosus]CAF3502442.1 unnamed protein product [Didymodactylos carnosus]CAF3535162.1 unnamed protein product [Didymodactylos carnosus]
MLKANLMMISGDMSMWNVLNDGMYHMDYNETQNFGMPVSANLWPGEHSNPHTSYTSMDDVWPSSHSYFLPSSHQYQTTYITQQHPQQLGSSIELPQQQHCLTSIPQQSTTMDDGSSSINSININSYQDYYSPLYYNQFSTYQTPISPALSTIVQKPLNELDSTSYNSTSNSSSTVPWKSFSKIRSTDVKQPCQVCGDESSGYHFGAFTCESCKAFYRRVLHGTQDIKHSCESPQDINKSNRKDCRACRYEKCARVGMSTTNKRLPRKMKQINSGYITNTINNANSHQHPTHEGNDSQIDENNCSHIIHLFDWLGNWFKNGQQQQQSTYNYSDYSLFDVIETVLNALDITQARAKICADVYYYDLYKLCEYHIRKMASTNLVYNFLTANHSFTVILFLFIILFNMDFVTSSTLSKSSSAIITTTTTKMDKLFKILHHEIGNKCQDKRTFNIVKALFMKSYVEVATRTGEETQYSNNNSNNVEVNHRIL